MEIIKKISPAGPVGAAKSGGDAVCRCIAEATSEAPAGPAPHFRSGPDKSRIKNPLVTGSLLDRFYRYTWPGPPEDFLLVEPCERSTTIGATQFPRLFAVATVPRLRGSTSGPGGEMSFPAVARTPPQLPTGAFSLIPYKFTRGNSPMISRVHARARKGIADQGVSARCNDVGLLAEEFDPQTGPHAGKFSASLLSRRHHQLRA
jgi:hypothetical protein